MRHHDSAAEPSAAPAATAQAPAASPTTPAATDQEPAATGQEAAAPAGTQPPRFDMVAWAVHRIERRRAKTAAEIERNRRGEPAVPTWVLAVALIAILGAWAALIMLS